MRGPSAKAALAVVVAAFLVSCASTTGNDGSTPTTTAPVSESTETSRPPESNGASTGATEATIALVLAEQITSLGGANGEEPTCTDEAEVFMDPGEAGVWLLQGPEATETVAMPFAIRLCLAGFASGSVTLDVEVGGDTYQSTLVLEGQSDEGVFTREGPETLFVDGATIRMSALDEGIYESDGWEFVPPPAIRDELAQQGRVTLTAQQGSLTTTRTQPVETPSTPYRYWLDFGPPFLLVYGFEEGQRVPVGLYRNTGPAESSFETRFTLVAEIGVVTMPPSRIVVFEVPPDVLEDVAGQERHCVTVPLEGDEESNCPEL